MSFFRKPEICKWIDKMFNYSFEREWYETYWAFDLHGVIINPHKRGDKSKVDFYPYAKELLLLLSEREDIVMFTFSSSYPDEMDIYKEIFEELGIKFKYYNENPEISDLTGSFGYYVNKPYYNVLFEDKSGFKPEFLKDVYKQMKKYKEKNYTPSKDWK